MKEKKFVPMARNSRPDLNPPSATAKTDRQVNNLLNTLRGEQFRHSQNVNRSKIRIPNALNYTQPTLPLSQIFGRTSDGPSEPESPLVQPAPFRRPGQDGHWRRRPLVTLIEGVPTYAYPDGAVPGPRPPKSWSALFDKEERNNSSWRADALSILFSDLPLSAGVITEDRPVQPLTRICMRALLSACATAQELAELALYIAPHLRRDIMRWCAIHQPLSNAKLYALCGNEGHADGELVIAGPAASLRIDYIRRFHGRDGGHAASPTLLEEDVEWEVRDEDEFRGNGRLEDWDEASQLDTPPPLTCLVLLKTGLLVPSALPPTLTHLALLALPHPTHVHQLPRICPLLEVLDLSFNAWLSETDTSTVAEGTLDRVEWTRWRKLRLLGLRECGVTKAKVAKVNAGRWADVEIIGVQENVA